MLGHEQPGGSNSRKQFLPKLVFWRHLLVLLLGDGGLHDLPNRLELQHLQQANCRHPLAFACCRCWSSSRFGRSGMGIMGSIGGRSNASQAVLSVPIKGLEKHTSHDAEQGLSTTPQKQHTLLDFAFKAIPKGSIRKWIGSR